MPRQVNSETLDKLKSWEGFVGYAYDDADPTTPKYKVRAGQKIRGTLTAGYGHTGPDVIAGVAVTPQQAEKWLRADIARFEANVEQLVKVPLTDNQFGALVSFDYNTGALAQSSLLKELNAGNYTCVPLELAKWIKTTVNGKKVKSEGLVNRRASEIGLWASGAPVASNNVEATPVMRPIITPESIGVGSAAVASCASVFDGSGPVQWAIGAIIVVGFIVAGVWFFKRRMGAK